MGLKKEKAEKEEKEEWRAGASNHGLAPVAIIKRRSAANGNGKTAATANKARSRRSCVFL
jgi:hypothetical protein